ncbi:hypothetical protein ACMGD3_23930 [Lysinibacillus sphaericus]
MKYLFGFVGLVLFMYLLFQGLNVTQELNSTSDGSTAMKEITWDILVIWVLVFGTAAIVKIIRLKKQN